MNAYHNATRSPHGNKCYLPKLLVNIKFQNIWPNFIYLDVDTRLRKEKKRKKNSLKAHNLLVHALANDLQQTYFQSCKFFEFEPETTTYNLGNIQEQLLWAKPKVLFFWRCKWVVKATIQKYSYWVKVDRTSVYTNFWVMLNNTCMNMSLVNSSHQKILLTKRTASCFFPPDVMKTV